MSTDKVHIDEDELATLQFTTPFTLVPLVEAPCAKAAPTVTDFHQLEARGTTPMQAGLHAGAKDATSVTLPSSRQSGNPPPPPQRSLTPEAQLETRVLREDATAANWGSHLLIQVGTDTSHVTLKAGNLDNNCDQIVDDPIEPIYYGCKE